MSDYRNSTVSAERTYMCDTNTNFPIDTRTPFDHLSSALKESNTSS